MFERWGKTQLCRFLHPTWKPWLIWPDLPDSRHSSNTILAAVPAHGYSSCPPGVSCSWTRFPAQYTMQPHLPRVLSQQRRMTTNHDCSSSKVVQRRPLASTTPSSSSLLFLKMTLVPHHCACPGQPGAQLPTDTWGVGALQPSKGLNLPQSCHKLTGLSPSVTLSGPTGVGIQP